MNAIRMLRRVESDTLTLTDLRPLIGKMVEIIVLETSPANAPTGDESNPYEAFFHLSGKDVVDPEAYTDLRAASLV